MIAGLPPGYRCVAPTLPPGAHRRVMKPSADRPLPGMARLAGEFLDRLGLADVTLVGNDSGGAITQMLISGGAPWVGRAVLASCEAFGNFPPGLTGRTLALAGKLPPTLFGLVIQQMRIRPLRPLPNAFGWLTKRGDAATAWNQSSPSAASAATRSTCSAPLRRQGPAAPRRRKTPRLPRARTHRLGEGRPGHAARTRPAPGRASPAGTADRDRRQLRPHPARPAGQARPAHRRLHPRTGQHHAVTPAPAQAMSTHTRGSPAGPRLPCRAGHRRATQPCPPASKTRRFSGWLLSGYLPLIPAIRAKPRLLGGLRARWRTPSPIAST
jgi:pimeloyl-ACP methyl ester carboxylesterase